MIFRPLELEGAYLIEPERREDERGFFARIYCREEFTGHGLVGAFVQSSISFNKHALTLRGMHYQVAPSEEVKLVRCTAGAIHDVIVDLRKGSPTRWKWVAVDLTAANRNILYVPCGFAHGFLTTLDNTEVEYDMSMPHDPAAARGFRWNDPATAGPAELFYSLYFAMTGLHGIHVIVGIIIITAMMIMVWRDSKYTRNDYITLEMVGLYWHFVDLVWIFLFPLFYLMPG